MGRLSRANFGTPKDSLLTGMRMYVPRSESYRVTPTFQVLVESPVNGVRHVSRAFLFCPQTKRRVPPPAQAFTEGSIT